MKPSFSVVIATHRRPSLLARAIHSVRNQEGVGVQILVISDCIDNETYSVTAALLGPDDRFVQRVGPAGPAHSRNIGLQLSHNSHVIFLDDDDSFRPGCFASISNELQNVNSETIMGINAEVIYEGTQSQTSSRFLDFSSARTEQIWIKNFLPNNCVVYPLSLARTIKFDPEMAYEDWDYLLASLSHTSITMRPIWGACIHKNATEDNRGTANNNALRLVDCYLKIYARYPAPSHELQEQRRVLLASVGLELPGVQQN